MSYELRLVVVALAAFAAASLLGSMLVSLMWPRALRHAAAARASALLMLRLLPASGALLTAIVAGAAYLVFERPGDEPVGLVLTALALMAAGLMTSALIRGWKLARATRRMVGEWMRAARPVELPGCELPAFAVDTAFPVVAIVGVRRPRLVIARSVLGACSTDEIRAIVAHEQNHADSGDNARRALLAAAPDVLSWLPAADRIRSAWHEAAEDAADDAADRLGDAGRLTLAEALVRVARLVPAGARLTVQPASALYCGENIDRRVRRLLVPAETSGVRQARWPAAAAACLALAAMFQLKTVHWVVEAAVTFLP